MGFFSDLFNGQAYTYATSFKKLCMDSGISIYNDNILFDDTCSDLIFFIMSGKVTVSLHTKSAILGYLRSDNPKIHNAKDTAIYAYIYSVIVYGGNILPSQIEKDKKIFEEVFGY